MITTTPRLQLPVPSVLREEFYDLLFITIKPVFKSLRTFRAMVDYKSPRATDLEEGHMFIANLRTHTHIRPHRGRTYYPPFVL